MSTNPQEIYNEAKNQEIIDMGISLMRELLSHYVLFEQALNSSICLIEVRKRIIELEKEISTIENLERSDSEQETYDLLKKKIDLQSRHILPQMLTLNHYVPIKKKSKLLIQTLPRE